MKKKTRNVLRTITAGILTVAVAAATITENEQALFARETFSGLQSIIENNQQLTLVEVVDDFSEASFGYLVEGMEPFDEAAAKREGTMEELLDDLRSRGLLTTGNTDDWNSYPLRYEVTDTVYSNYADDQELKNAGYRQLGDSYATVRGYYEWISDDEITNIPRAFYRLKKEGAHQSYNDIKTMSPSKLREIAEEILDSYAPDHQDEDPDYIDGYSTTEPGFLYFRFISGEPENGMTVQAQSISVDAASVSEGAAMGIGGATPTPPKMVTPADEELSDTDGIEADEELPSEDESVTDEELTDVDGTKADGEQSADDTDVRDGEEPAQSEGEGAIPADTAPTESNGTTPADTTPTESNGTTPADTAPTESNGATSANTTIRQSTEVQPDQNAQPDGAALEAQSGSGENASPDTAQAEGVATVSDSASAVIYVELDENNSVLVASLGNAGVEDILDGTVGTDGERSSTSDAGSAASTPAADSSAVAGLGSGGVTVTSPALVPTPGNVPSEENGSGTSASGSTDSSTTAPSPSGASTLPEGSSGTENESTSPTPADDADAGNADTSTSPTPTDEGNGTDSDDNTDPSDQENGELGEEGTEGDGESEGDDTETEPDEEPSEYTVSYAWASAPACTDGQYLKDRSGDEHQLADPAEWEEKVSVGGSYSVNAEYGEGMVLELYGSDDTLRGTYTFSGWKKDGSDEVVTEILELTEDMKFIGEWTYEPADIDTSCSVTYEWILEGAEAGSALPDGVKEIGDIVLRSPIQMFGMDSEPKEITCPEGINGTIGDTYTVNGDFSAGDIYDAYDKQGNLIGTCVFQGWEIKGTKETLVDDGTECIMEGDITYLGRWLFSLRANDASATVTIGYQWEVVSDESGSYADRFPTGSEADGRYILDNNTVLPDGVKLENGGYLDSIPKLPDIEDDYLVGESYTLAGSYSDGTTISVYENDELVGTYTFSGWNRVFVDGDEQDWDNAMLEDGFEALLTDEDGNVQTGKTIMLSGSWTYMPAYSAGTIIGTGKVYTYVMDGIHNNNWFRYYVLGLEEKDYGKCNIQLVTYLADGSDKRMAGYGPLATDCSLNEALSKADLVYLNTNGVWTDDEGNTISSDRRFSTENAKTLLERACNSNRNARLAVILDNSVQNNQVDQNVQKVVAVLCQEDIAEAYESLSEDGMSYEKAFSSDEWQRLNSLAVVRNGGNFVHENIYCVSHSRGEFNNSTYPAGESVVRPGWMPALANADFENRFTDNVTDSGFAEVYQAIQKENYERARNSGQASLDEYVMPATAVAYILNYRDYDPIIYKDKIRVLELQPCRDYTYYYDGQSGTTEFELKKKFAHDWAQDFVAKLDADPDAITIDGMTTSEFCGKILDIYEEYDVIYFGANSGILNRITQPAGFKWVKMDAYDGIIGANNPYQPVAWEQNYYTYHDGNWYLANATGEKKWVRIDGPLWDYENDSDTWDGTRNWRWNASEKRWEVKTAQTGWNWVPADQPYGETKDVWINGHHYYYDSSVPCWREECAVYTEGEIRHDGPPQGGSNWFDNGSAENSTWMWKASSTEWGDEIKLTNDSSQRLYERGWYQKVWIEEVSYTNYALWGNNSEIDREMNGLLYTHVGGRIGAYHWGGGNIGHLASNESQLGFRTSGNDILKTQVEELIHYLDGGSLVILAPEFMTENAAGGQIINSSDVTYSAGGADYRGILDTSSYVYQFVRQCFERKEDGTDVPRYLNLIVEDYGNGELKDTEAFVEALNQQKVTLNLYAAPEAYAYDTVESEYGRIEEDSRTMLQKAADGKYYLNYEFIIGNLSAVAPLTTRYHVQLFLDSNSDGIYNTASEELSDITVINAQTGTVMERQGGKYQLQMGVPYRVVRELPDGYVGCIGWKLMVSQNGNMHIHDSVTGLTAVPVQPGYSDEVNPETGKKIIHVLQITPDLWASAMDLEKQTEEDGDATVWVDGEMIKKNPGQYGTSDASRDWEWYRLLNELPDFEINFDSIYYWDFAHSFLKPGDSGYDPQFDNGGVDGKLTGPYGRTDYLNLYQYDMVIVGFHDSIPSIPSQAAIDALLRYADTGKSMLFTHDTTYNSNFDSVPPDMFSSDALGQPFSMSIRELCAMDRFGVSVDWYNTDENGVKHSNVAVSPIRNTGGVAAVAYNESSDAYQWNASHPGGTSRDVAYAPGTNQTMMAAQTQGTTWVYTGTNSATVMFDWGSHGFNPLACGHNMNRDTANADKTCEVSQVNGGIITQYPYDIPEEIRVASTHGQYYQLDLDTDWDGDGRGDVVCWYAIKSLDDGDWNDIYDFSPNDVRNCYYIYNKGNITYSGVGHDTEHITLDEKKLFINTFVAAYSAGIRNPSVRIVEDGSVNAPDLENVSIPFNGVDEATAGTYRVYYQVKDNNITQGTRNLSVKYYIGNPAGSDMVTYRTEAGSSTIPADRLPNNEMAGDGGLITYSADTGLPVRYDEVRSGFTYYVDVPLNRLLDNEKFDFYVEVDLTMADDPGRVAAFDVDKLTIAKIKMFSLD